MVRRHTPKLDEAAPVLRGASSLSPATPHLAREGDLAKWRASVNAQVWRAAGTIDGSPRGTTSMNRKVTP
jgi:hypothetical protein